MAINNQGDTTPTIEVAKSPAGIAPADVSEVQDTAGAQLSTFSQEGQGVQVDIDETQQLQDVAALQTGLETAQVPALPEDMLAGKIPAGMARGLLKFLRDDAKPKKTFSVGEEAPIDSNKEYEQVSLVEATSLVGQTTANYKTDDLWQTNFNQLENDEDVNGLIAAVSENMKDEIMEKRGGIRKDEEIIKLAEDLGTDPEFVHEFVYSKESDFVSPEKILAARKVLNKSAGYLHDLAVLVTSGKANNEQKLAFKKQFAFHQQFMGQFMAKRANIGRALRAYGLPAGIGDAQADHIQEMLHRVHGGLDIDKAAEQIATAPNAKAIHGVVDAQDSLMRKFGNVFIENFVNSILSGVKTHIINTTGSALMIGMRTLDTALAARLGTPVDDLAMKADKDEWKAGVFGMMNGAQDAFATMWQVMKSAEAYGGVSKIENTGRAYISAEYLGVKGAAGTIVDGIGHVIRAPTERLMGGVDGFMKVIAERQSLAATAYRIVNAEAEANNWTQEQTLKRLGELVQNPTPEMIQEANENALHVTFQTPLGDWGKTVQKAAGANPFTQFFMPFVKTPANLMKQGFLERTPLAMITDKYQKDVAAGGARAQMAKARMYIGTSFVMAAGAMAATGQITGAGSNNFKVKKAQMDSGWRPYSFVVTDKDGKKTYVSYQRTEPLSYIFSTIADFHDTMKLQQGIGVSDEKQAEVFVGALITAMSHATLDRSFMTGLESVMDLMSNPNATKVNSWVKRTVNAQIPFSGLRRDVTRVFDDSKKMTDSIFTEMQANIPYYSQSLPNRLDSLGLPVKYDNVLNPLPVVGERNNMILDEAVRLGMIVNKNPISLPQGLINGVRLSAQQYHDYVKFSRDTKHRGKSWKDIMTRTLNSSEYKFATDDQKYEWLRSITTDFNNMGQTMLFAQDKELFMKTKQRELEQASDALKAKTGEDAKTTLERLKLKIGNAYDRAFN